MLNFKGWYNSTCKNNKVIRPMVLIRVPRLVNLVHIFLKPLLISRICTCYHLIHNLEFIICFLFVIIFQASNAYLELLKGSQTKILCEYIKEIPKPETKLTLDITSLIGPLFFTWVILLLFPVSL